MIDSIKDVRTNIEILFKAYKMIYPSRAESINDLMILFQTSSSIPYTEQTIGEPL